MKSKISTSAVLRASIVIAILFSMYGCYSEYAIRDFSDRNKEELKNISRITLKDNSEIIFKNGANVIKYFSPDSIRYTDKAGEYFSLPTIDVTAAYLDKCDFKKTFFTILFSAIAVRFGYEVIQRLKFAWGQ